MEVEEVGNRLKEIMSMKGIKRREIADKLGISYNTLTKKLNGQRDFNVNEILMLKEILKLDADLCGNVFFNPDFIVTKYKKKIVMDAVKKRAN